MIPTPHIKATDANEIAKTVLMPGDPLRAKYIADNFLEDVVCFNTVRNMFGYTGTYKGKKVSVMGSGMGMPSIGIYSYELYKFYDVDRIMRIGSAGAYTDKLNIFDVVLATSAWSESTFAKVMCHDERDEINGSEKLHDVIRACAKEADVTLTEGVIHSSDVFYRANFDEYKDIYNNHGCLAAEMESFALFANADYLGKEAACLVTISDSLVTHEVTSSEEREQKLNEMIKVALEAAIR